MIIYKSKIYIKNILNKLILLSGDFSGLVLSFYIAYYIRGILYNLGLLYIPNLPLEYFYSYWYLFFIHFSTHLFFLYLYKIYSIRFSFWQEAKEILKALTIGTIFVFFILGLLKFSEQASRFIIISIGMLSIFMLPLIKLLLKYLLYKFGFRQVDSLIIAGPDTESELNTFCESLLTNWYVGYKPGYIIKTDSIGIASLDEYLTYKRLKKIIKENNIVLPILYKIDKSDFYNIFTKLDIFFENIKLVPDLHSIFVNNISIEDDGNNLLINFNNNVLRLYNRFIQYLFNKIASIFIFILLIPLFLIISIAILIDSKGSILYKAKRIGYKDKDFYIYKFRTMFKDADRELENLLASNPELRREFDESFKIKDDPRITGVGKFLRKTSLDELPQIINVLKGEMNLVGPRPIVRDELNKYGDAFYELIKVKPGITGLWQVSGRNDIDYDKRVQLDLFYMKNWSIWMDVIILIRTLLVVLRRDGAY